MRSQRPMKERESALVAPAVEAHVGPQLVQCFGTRCQLGVSDSVGVHVNVPTRVRMKRDSC